MRHFALPALGAGLLAASAVHAADGASVIITGQRASLTRAIAAQEQADHIVSVVSSDDIGQLPDRNAAEALARLPGVSVQRDQGEGRYVVVRGLDADYNSVLINGALVPSPEATRRAVALDVLPAGLIRSLKVSKSLTPEQDASSLGGTVEVETLSAFDLPGKLLSGGVATGRADNGGRRSGNANLLWAQRFAGGKLGVAAGLSGERRKFASDNVETGGAWNGERLSGFELRDYLPERERHAAALNLDYRPDSETSYALRAFLSRFSDNEVRDRLTLGNFADGDVAEGETASARAERRLRQRKYTQEIGSVTAALHRRIGQRTRLHVEAALSRASEETPESINDARFRGVANFSGIGFSDGTTPRLTATDAVYDPARYGLNAITLQQRHSSDRARQLRVDLQHDIDAGDWRGAVKGGLKTIRRDKENDTQQWRYNSKKPDSGQYWGAGPVAMSSFVSGNEIDYQLGRIGVAIDPALVRARVTGLDRAGALLAAESALDDFRMSEHIDAAYVQASLGRGAWTVLAGVRAERTRFLAAGMQVADDTLSAQSASRSYTNWLPGIHARYDLDRATSVRAAWSNAVVRANFSQLSPGISLDSDTEAVLGNPGLAPLRARNLDVGIERVLGNDGVLSAYLFHKRIRDFVYGTNLAGSGKWAGFTSALSYANGEQARVHGIELSWQQPLRMLPAPFNGVLVGVNGALTRARAGIDSASDGGGRAARTIRMPGQSDRTGNVMLGYEGARASARLAVNYKSPYLLELGEDVLDPAQERIVDSQRQVDLALAWRLNRRWQVSVEASNLTNEHYYVYQGIKRHNAQYEQYGRSYKIGLKASIF